MRSISAVGILMVIASSVMPWIEGSILGGLPDPGSAWAAFFVGIVGGMAWLARWKKLPAVVSIIALGVCSLSLTHLALKSPVLASLVDEHRQYVYMTNFSTRFLAPNLGVEPAFKVELATNTLADRLSAALHFVGPGWWTCLAGSLIIFLGCLADRWKQSLWWGGVTLLVILLGQGILHLESFRALDLLGRGESALSEGRFEEAARYYGEAQKTNSQLGNSDQICLRLGEASVRPGVPLNAYGRFYLADYYARQESFESAVSEYLLAFRDAPPVLRKIIRRRIAWSYVNLGFERYENEEIGQAVSLWEKALDVDPEQIQVLYLLSRAYFDQARFEQGIVMGRRFLTRSRNRLLNADVQANLGDGYWKLNDFDRARGAYEKSMRLDAKGNFRVIKSLGGT